MSAESDNVAPFAPKGEAPSTRSALIDLLAYVEEEATDSYCELCQSHAPKDRDGNLTGNVKHAQDCAVSRARAALSVAEPPSMREALEACMFALGRGGANCVEGHNRAEWEAARAALSAPPPPEPVVRWCLKDPDGKLRLDAWEVKEAAYESWRYALEKMDGYSLVRVEIVERPA